MYQVNKAQVAAALAQASAELSAIQTETTTAEAALLADALAREPKTAGAVQQFTADLYAAAGAIATLAERERIAQARVDALTTMQTAFDAAFA